MQQLASKPQVSLKANLGAARGRVCLRCLESVKHVDVRACVVLRSHQRGRNGLQQLLVGVRKLAWWAMQGARGPEMFAVVDRQRQTTRLSLAHSLPHRAPTGPSSASGSWRRWRASRTLCTSPAYTCTRPLAGGARARSCARCATCGRGRGIWAGGCDALTARCCPGGFVQGGLPRRSSVCPLSPHLPLRCRSLVARSTSPRSTMSCTTFRSWRVWAATSCG